MTADPITAMRDAESKILALANELGKFGVPLTANLADDQQLALERLQLSGRIRLIDVSLVSHPEMPGLYRMFQVMKP